MKIESKDFKIKNIFSRRKYIIPDYQRDYSWRVGEEILIFWKDFLYYLNDKSETNFFIGPMVYEGNDVNASEFQVIDGQQRLITLSILISVLVELFKKNGRVDLADGLKQSSLIFKDEKNIDQLVIETIEPHPFFQARIFHGLSNVSPKKSSEILIERARDFFEREVEQELSSMKTKDEKIGLLEKIRDHVFDIDTVIIVSDNEVDAFTIFETINTRGKDLSSLDLLKNYIFKNYNKKTGIDEPKETWKKVVKNIESDRDNFFNRFWASWVDKVTENKLYRRFNDYIRGYQNQKFTSAEKLLDELSSASDMYRKIIKSRMDDWKINKNYGVYFNIKNINLFKVKVHIPFLMAIFEEYDKGNISIKELNRSLLLLENFHFIFSHIVSERASGLDNKYSKFAIRLREEADKKKVIDDLRNELIEKMPTKVKYIENFKRLNYDDKVTVKFILLRLEKEIDPALTLDFEMHSIDHLEPRSGKGGSVNSIGNLFLLEEGYNNIKDDKKPFAVDPKNKVTIIEYFKKNTKYKTTKKSLEEIMNGGRWTDNEIDARTEKLAIESYNLFSRLK